MNSQLYPQGPGSVPHDLTAPGNKYKRHVWIASLAILLFVVFYFSLSSWFLYTSYRLFANAFSDGRDGFLSFIGGTLMGFLGIFMFKAIFFFTSNDKSDDIEISREEEPELFEFIYKLADEARAPRPHKIFLSNRVNASVFYDLSIINLIFPSRKNLEIGLGLINVLNLGEFKSILAHEFGHFTQRSMIIGRWVYIAHQIAYQIVAKRDFLDRFLAGLSSVDLRVAWIGWLLSLIVWSIRSFAEVFFKLVLLTQRALSREMEFHADLVAVSLTGSDALIHSLYKLGAADSAYDDALRFVNKQLEKNKATADIYAIQENSIKQMAIVLNNPVYGLSPKMPEGKRSDFRVFKEQIAQPPKMWSTHPANTDRENNAKKIYIPAEIDERSAWILFKDPDKIKNRLTLELYKTLTIETTSLAREESLAEHNKEFQSSFLLPRYRGVYLNRKITEAYSSSAEIYSMSINPADLPKKLSLLYPASLQEELERLKNLDEEILMLEGLKNKVLDANEGKIKYRGEEIKRSQLPEVIERVRNEAKAERDKINEHDKLCRNVHYAIARSIGQGWDKYIFSLTSLIHYCEHNQSNIEEQSRFFYDTLAVVSGMKNVNSSELNQLLTAASELHLAMKKVFVSSKGLALTPVIVSKLDGKSLSEMLGEFELAGANEGNINSWISVLPSWLQLTLNSLSDLRAAVLDELLNTEDYVAKLAGAKPEAVKPAPEPLFIPTGYPLSGSSEKRELIKDTGVWSRFQNSEGIFPTIARLTVAASIIIAAVGFGGNIGSSRVVIYNGLSIPVIVSVDGKETEVGKESSSELDVSVTDDLRIRTTTASGKLIEEFNPTSESSNGTYVYNVAYAAVLYEWTVYYGYSSDDKGTLFGASRWTRVNADYYFTDPPQSVTVKAGSSTSRDVVSAYKAHPSQLINVINNEEERGNFIASHALWEESNSPDLLTWMTYASGLKNISAILDERLKNNPLEIVSLRAQQDVAAGDEKSKVCEKQKKLYRQHPDNPDLYYLNCRCMNNEAAKDSGFIAGHNKWPDNAWLAYATGYTYVQNERWKKAIECFDVVYNKEPLLRLAISDEMGRMYQLLGREEVEFNNLEGPYLDYVKSIENSREDNSENLLFAYKLLSQGKLQEAIVYSEADTGLHASIIRLAAVSKGASREIISQALAFSPEQGLTNATIIPAIALMIKSGKSSDSYKKLLADFSDVYSDSVNKFIDYARADKLAEADKMLLNMTAEMKGKMSLLGCLLEGDKAPDKWKIYASRLLFINEKPFLDFDRML